MKRTVIAFLVAPLIPAVVFAYNAGLGFSVIWSYLCSYVFGIPVFLILRRMKKERHWLYAMFGFICGALYILAINISNLNQEILTAAAIFALVGAATALCFSLVRGHEIKKAEPAATAQRP